MPDFAIEQALYHRPDNGAPARVAQSLAFREEWHAELETIVAGFGERPPGVKCPIAVFARPLAEDFVGVAHVADPDAGGLGLRCLILPPSASLRYPAVP